MWTGKRQIIGFQDGRIVLHGFNVWLRAVILTICTGKFIEKEVTQFIREECGKLPQLNRAVNADLKAIATNSSTQDILKVKHAYTKPQAPKTQVN